VNLLPSDFTIAVIVTSKKCFGSAGCSYKYTTRPTYGGVSPLPPTATVIYNLTGGTESQVGRFTIKADGTATVTDEESIQGEDGAVFTATVTQVLVP